MSTLRFAFAVSGAIWGSYGGSSRGVPIASGVLARCVVRGISVDSDSEYRKRRVLVQSFEVLD